MSIIIKRTPEPETPEVDYWGVCPTCHKNNGYINVGRSHWFFCKEHKVCWCAGIGLFSPADDETLKTQEAVYNELGMQNYKEVEPYTGETND